jgi:hypothetical protein
MKNEIPKYVTHYMAAYCSVCHRKSAASLKPASVIANAGSVETFLRTPVQNLRSGYFPGCHGPLAKFEFPAPPSGVPPPRFEVPIEPGFSCVRWISAIETI